MVVAELMLTDATPLLKAALPQVVAGYKLTVLNEQYRAVNSLTLNLVPNTVLDVSAVPKCLGSEVNFVAADTHTHGITPLLYPLLIVFACGLC